MKIPYKGGGIALFQKNSETGEYSMLLGKRRHHPGKGKWSIPGGGYEKRDKDLAETARREFREETGLSLEDIVIEENNLPVVCNMLLMLRLKISFFRKRNHFLMLNHVLKIL